jgi:hypothetical protein
VLSIVREVRNPNRNEAFRGQNARVGAAGKPYADLGRARVFTLRGDVAIARVEFSCAPIVPGDLVVPFEERAPIVLSGNTQLERFPREAAGPIGQIVLAKDFDSVLGTGNKVYIDVGSEQGAKAGDYFRIVRYYDEGLMDDVDRLSYMPPASEDTQVRRVKVGKRETENLPRRTVAEAVILMANPGSSTAMITYAVEDVLVGDQVELEPAATATR